MTSIEWLWEQIPFEFTSKRSAFEVLEQAKEMHKQEMEISDEEIEKSMRRYNITDFGQMAAYVVGAKWYREKLKQRQ
ncbi:MAG: hypothetical protein RLZ10_631 [Bacteroidota bacterium]|jgi:hypothetical protein